MFIFHQTSKNLILNKLLGISFTPREIGEHQVIVTRNGKPIQGSPFKVQVGDKEVGNASRVKLIGTAMKEGKTQVLNEFTVDTKSAGKVFRKVSFHSL